MLLYYIFNVTVQLLLDTWVCIIMLNANKIKLVHKKKITGGEVVWSLQSLLGKKGIGAGAASWPSQWVSKTEEGSSQADKAAKIYHRNIPELYKHGG